jgi:hypothetical protein
LVFEQGSLARGKLFRQHGEISDSRIHRRRFPGRVLIDCALLGDEGVQISNSDKNLYIAVRQSFCNLDLVQVPRRVVVNRRPQLAPQIAHTSSRRDYRRMSPQLHQLLLHPGRKVGLKAVLPHNVFRDGLQVYV